MTTKEEYEEYMYIEVKGKKKFVEENGLDYLLEHFNNSIFFLNGKLFDKTSCIYMAINCNDLFYWACADLEIFSWLDIENLYLASKEEKWGISKWACKKRGMRPQHPIEDDMKKDGAWDDEMELLPVRGNTG